MKKTVKIFYLVLSVSFLFLLTDCEKKQITPDEETEQDDNNDDDNNDDVFNLDYFSYYENSIFQFNMESKNSDNIITTGTMSFFVESYDENTHTSKIIVSKNYSGNTPLGGLFYIRKTAENTLETSTTGSGGWKLWLDCENLSTDFYFILTGTVSKPSGLLGSIDVVCASSSVSTDAGSFSTLKIHKAYNNSSNDNYLYDDVGTEHFDKEIGFIYSYMKYIDHSMGYPYYISMHRTIKLAACKIYLPDGSIIEKGEVEDDTTIPNSPDNLTGSRLSGTSVELGWQDNSLNETGFEIERKEFGSSNYVNIATADFNSTNYTDNTAVASKEYEYRIKAVNSAGESDYSNEIAVGLFGVPLAPWDLQGGYNYNMNFLYLMWWARVSDNISHYQIAILQSGQWTDLSYTPPYDPSSFSNGNCLQSTYLYYNGGQAFPAGTYTFKIKAINDYGGSYYSNIVEVSVTGKNKSKINYKLIQIKN